MTSGHVILSTIFITSLVTAIGGSTLSSVGTTTSNAHCKTTIDGIPTEKSIGDIWNSNDPCEKYICESGPNNTAQNRTVREYCFLKCNNEYELVVKAGQCCGECVRTKCRADEKIYNIGDMWKSKDGCTFSECVQRGDSVSVASYKKTCPELNNCSTGNVFIKDCCPNCRSGKQATDDDETSHEFTFDSEKFAKILDKNTYLNHPCVRDCQDGSPPMTCNYTFVLEWYETLSKACYDCPFNETDCYRPHCIYADGVRRSILVVNRMMPGPPIQVCKFDKIVVDVVNKMMGESTSIHWHGMHQRETPYMDGVPFITQCPIPPHTTFRYSFIADHEGTHWWHSHIGMQRTDGAFGALIVRQPMKKIQFGRLYDYDLPEHIMIIQDWDVRTGTSSFNSFHHSIGNNKPKNILINGKGKFYERKVEVKKKVAVSQIYKNPLSTTTTTTPTPVTTTTTERGADHHVHGNINNPVKFDIPLNPELQEELDPASFPTVHRIEEGEGTQSSTQKREIRSTEPVLVPFEVFEVHQGENYRFRTINAGFLNCPVEISIDNHTLTVIASDGEYFEPVVVSTLVTYAGERFDFVVNADQPIGNYWIRVRGLMDCDERFEKAHQVAILRYRRAAIEHPAGTPTYDYQRDGLKLNALNRGTGQVESVSIAELTSLDEVHPKLLQPNADFQFYVYYDFYDSSNPHFNDPNLYANDAMTTIENQFIGPQLNRIAMKMPSSPLLVAKDNLDESGFCNETSLMNKNIDCVEEFCECTHVLQVPLNASVELIIVDEGYRYDANHPFHLHGQGFRVVAMERLKPSGIKVEEIQELDRQGHIVRRLKGAPMKDTITVPDGGFTIVRFVADNPGWWLFHCHIEFHIEVGMALVFKVGDVSQMKTAPKNFPMCSNYMPRMGYDMNGNGAIVSQLSWYAGVTVMLVQIVINLISF